MPNTYQKIYLKKGKEKSLERFHPWIYSGAIKKLPEAINEGELVSVYSYDNNFLAVGYYQVGSLAVHILTFEQTVIDQKFWTDRVAEAVQLRVTAGMFNNEKTNVFRLIHGEGDQFPGLVVDYYNGCLVFQAHTVGMHLFRENITSALKSELKDFVLSIYDKSAKTLPFKAQVEHEDLFLFGEAKEEWEVQENGYSFTINVVTGQKTGFYIDQRANRKLLETYSKGKKVLNTFCYSGGFSVYALGAGAKLVHSVDSSEKAIKLTKENVEINEFEEERHLAKCEDVFKFLQDLPEDYDVIVLDPPAFAKHKRVIKQGINGYRTINEKAFKHIKKGGIIFTFSCSQVITMDHFRTAVFSAAARARRNVRILHFLHQPADHPINIFHPEGEYLKGLVLEVN